MLQILQILASSGSLRFLEGVDKEEDWIGVDVGVDVSTILPTTSVWLEIAFVSTLRASSGVEANLTTDGMFLHAG